MEAHIQFHPRNSLRQFPRAGVAKATRSQADPVFVRKFFYQAVIDRLALLVVKVGGYRPATVFHTGGAVKLGQGHASAMAQGYQVAQ